MRWPWLFNNSSKQASIPTSFLQALEMRVAVDQIHDLRVVTDHELQHLILNNPTSKTTKRSQPSDLQQQISQANDTTANEVDTATTTAAMFQPAQLPYKLVTWPM